jgi:hypothetical protein
MTDPLFVADLATLKKSVRLSGVPDSREDTLAILNEAILKARLDFNRRLGQQRVSQLAAIAFTENPATEDEILRALAGQVETKIVYVQLLRKLPNLFMDASGAAQRIWNEEAPFRERGPTTLDKEIHRLENEIEEDMEVLAEDEAMPDETTIKTFDGSRTTPAPRPGGSLRPIHNRCRRSIFED